MLPATLSFPFVHAIAIWWPREGPNPDSLAQFLSWLALLATCIPGLLIAYAAEWCLRRPNDSADTELKIVLLATALVSATLQFVYAMDRGANGLLASSGIGLLWGAMAWLVSGAFYFNARNPRP